MPPYPYPLLYPPLPDSLRNTHKEEKWIIKNKLLDCCRHTFISLLYIT